MNKIKEKVEYTTPNALYIELQKIKLFGLKESVGGKELIKKDKICDSYPAKKETKKVS